MTRRTEGYEDRQREELYAARIATFEKASPGYAGQWSRLVDRLLSIGGEGVIPHLEPDPLLSLLLGVGALQKPSSVIHRAGEPNWCHRNAAVLWKSGQSSGIGYGYALDDTAAWRCHGWAYGSSEELIETTTHRTAYFGVRVSDDRAEVLASLVLDPSADVEELLASKKRQGRSG